MVITLLFFLWTTFTPKTITYDFGRAETCVQNPRLATDLFSDPSKQSDTFKLERRGTVKAGGLTIYAHYLCAQSQNPPKENTTETQRDHIKGASFLGSSAKIRTTNSPRVITEIKDRISASPDTSLDLPIKETDRTFTYILTNKDNLVSCAPAKQKLHCNLARLGLAYATAYDLRLMRAYNGKIIDQSAIIPLRTITPTNVAYTSISSGSSAEQKPTEIVIGTDKPIKSTGLVTLVAKEGNTEKIIPTKTSFSDKLITVKLGQELPRKTAYELRIASVEAIDTSGFAGKSFALPFTTSGGPKVVRTNIGNKNVGLTQPITITFDQALLPNQDIGTHIRFSVHGAPFAASYTVAGNTVTVKPNAALPLCAPLQIKLSGNIQNTHTVSGDSTWTFSSRAICYTTFSIGTSVKGRGLTAYKFGTGAEHIVYIGGIHGSEANAKRIMEEWFKELQNYPERIPAGRSVVVIPSANPDGIATDSRYNARSVDLNRNFPANDWKSVVTSPTNSQPHPAGGPSPLSEPESAAIAAYVKQIQPRLVMSFHSKAAIVEANEAGDSVTIAAEYARRSRYQAVPKSKSVSIFKYDTTGAMEDWMRDKLGRVAIVVELATSTSSEFGRNKDALWYSLRF